MKVKALEWEELSERCWDADGMGKLYRVMRHGDGTAKLKHGVYDHGTEYPSLEAAKSAAFADYSARIMSAIEPAGVGVETQQGKLLHQCVGLMETLSEDLPEDDVNSIMMRAMVSQVRAALTKEGEQ